MQQERSDFGEDKVFLNCPWFLLKRKDCFIIRNSFLVDISATQIHLITSYTKTIPLW